MRSHLRAALRSLRPNPLVVAPEGNVGRGRGNLPRRTAGVGFQAVRVSRSLGRPPGAWARAASARPAQEAHSRAAVVRRRRGSRPRARRMVDRRLVVDVGGGCTADLAPCGRRARGRPRRVSAPSCDPRRPCQTGLLRRRVLSARWQAGQRRWVAGMSVPHLHTRSIVTLELPGEQRLEARWGWSAAGQRIRPPPPLRRWRTSSPRHAHHGCERVGIARSGPLAHASDDASRLLHSRTRRRRRDVVFAPRSE